MGDLNHTVVPIWARILNVTCRGVELSGIIALSTTPKSIGREAEDFSATFHPHPATLAGDHERGKFSNQIGESLFVIPKGSAFAILPG
jgi:hypothetical protein